MDSKQAILEELKAELGRWEALLAEFGEGQNGVAQLEARQLPGGLSMKDVLAHLWAWQQRSVARVEAALQGREPAFPGWPEGLDPDDEADLEPINAWIHASSRDKPWAQVYADWRAGFLRLLALSEAVPEKDLLEAGRYPWLGDYRLADVLIGSYRHHHEEHLEPLQAWLNNAAG